VWYNGHMGILLIQVPMGDVEVDGYISPDRTMTVRREYGLTPVGNPLGGNWVFRMDGQYMGHDQYRSDLASSFGLDLVSEAP